MARAITLAALACLPPRAHAELRPPLRRPTLQDAPLNTFPFLQSHDAGTGYLRDADVLTDVVYRFTRTQAGNVTSQLDCGVRAFDWRPSLDAGSGALGFAHGAVFVNHSMRDAAAEVVAWADAHAAELEDALVLLVVADCNGDACNAAAEAAFRAVSMPVLSGAAGCAAASDLTVGAAMAAAALAGGGHALALMNCPGAPVPTYDDRLSCTGFFNVTQGEAFEEAAAECFDAGAPGELEACLTALGDLADAGDQFACYADAGGRNASWPAARLEAWNAAAAAVPPPSGPGQRGLLVSLQGAWAQNVQSTALSFLANSSLLLDEVRSRFNAETLLEWLDPARAAPFVYVNLVGVNGACDGGPALAQQLRRRIPPSSPLGA